MLLTARQSVGVVYALSSTSVLFVVSAAMPVAPIVASSSVPVSRTDSRSVAALAASPGVCCPATVVVHPAAAATTTARAMAAQLTRITGFPPDSLTGLRWVALAW